jgi:hypothetical protein
MPAVYTKPWTPSLHIFELYPMRNVARSDQTTAVKRFKRKDNVSVETSIPN